MNVSKNVKLEKFGGGNANSIIFSKGRVEKQNHHLFKKTNVVRNISFLILTCRFKQPVGCSEKFQSKIIFFNTTADKAQA